MAEEDLKPGEFITKENASELGKRGGIRSGEVRKENKLLFQRIQDRIRKESEKLGLPEGVDVDDMIAIATSKEVDEKHRIAAWKALWEYGFSKPTQNIAVSPLDGVERIIVNYGSSKDKKSEDD